MSIVGTKRDGTKISFNDLKSRNFMIRFSKIAYNWELISNPRVGGIDLLFKDHPTGAGMEIEEIQCHGDYYSNKNFTHNSFLRNGRPPINEQTLNIPPRKHHYWMNGEVLKPTSGNLWYYEINEDFNYFSRHNIDQTQVLIVRPEIIKDFKSDRPSKVFISVKKATTIYDKNGEELWIGIPNEYVDRWDLIDGFWVLSLWDVEEKVWKENRRVKDEL